MFAIDWIVLNLDLDLFFESEVRTISRVLRPFVEFVDLIFVQFIAIRAHFSLTKKPVGKMMEKVL